jgi:small-conductance mechanosensitive channel
MRRSGASFLAVLAIAVALLGAAAALVLAQEEAQHRIDGWNATLDQIAATLTRPTLTAADLSKLRADAQTVLDDARSLTATLQPQIAAADARVQSLAPAPATGEPGPTEEIQAVAAERSREERHLAELTGMSRQADVAALRANQLLTAIAERRSLYFTTLLLERSPSLLSPALWRDVVAELPGTLTRGGRLFGDWVNLISARAERLTAILLIAVGVLAPLLFWLARRFLRYVTDRLAGASVATDGRKVAAATWVVAVNVVVPVLFVVLVGSILEELGFLPERMRLALSGILVAVVVFTLVNGLAVAILAPTRPDWRLATLGDAIAARLYSFLLAIALLAAAIPLVDRLAEITAAEPFLATAIGGALAMAIAVVVIVATRSFTRDRETQASTDGQESRGRVWRWAIVLAATAALVALVAGIFGYVAFARFLVGQIVWVGIVLALFALLSRLIDLIVSIVFTPDRTIGRWLTLGLGFGRRALGQVGVLAGGIVRLLLVLLAVVAIAAPWGFDSVSLADSVRGLFYTITFSAILAATAIFVIGVVVTRIVQAWLDSRLLPTTNLDPGLRVSIRTGIGYLGVILAAILAGAYAGLDLANIAIVAGALSVGIGFGLQSIVNNFVSGLIILAERPFQAGDWISVSGEEGTVKRINVRATEIETFDRASVIVPNSVLISGMVKNMVHRDRSGRVSVNVGVAYGSDAGQVRDLLLDCARAHSKVLGFPEPDVVFTDFGASSLDFELRCYLADISDGLTVRSDLRFAILEKLRAAGIEIPFPQRDVHLRDLSGIAKAFAGAAAPGSRDRQEDT